MRRPYCSLFVHASGAMAIVRPWLTDAPRRAIRDASASGGNACAERSWSPPRRRSSAWPPPRRWPPRPRRLPPPSPHRPSRR
ncbi:MAG: hypothetical protein E8A49_08120 [Phenylobacterium sp.]|nr:MAG: hypothetical protein E8A49_08120 [Phenylobacterium sp.]